MTASPQRDSSHLLFPLFLLSGVMIAIVPWLHPYATCHDWLENWGNLMVGMRGWVLIHKIGMAGFALAAGVGLFYPLLGARTMASIAAGTCLTTGFGFMAMLTMIHATAASSLGKSFNAATDPTQRAVIRSVAEAFMAYDVGANSAASVLISAGSILLTFTLWKRGVYPLPLALFMMLLGSVWTAQYHGIFPRLGFSISEYLHWGCLGVWLAATGGFLYLAHWQAERKLSHPPPQVLHDEQRPAERPESADDGARGA